MENVPPSYDAAVARNPWSLIAPFIPSAELCALNRVSKELHNVFAPCLWGNPASHFGTENDRVYVALTRFKRTLKRVRLSVRELTHTLHLPPAQSEIYDGPHPEWLRDVLEQLPNLQSLIVSRLPFFDHMALLALRSYSDGRRPSLGGGTLPMFTLRLLIASNCQNTTSQGLSEALDHFPNLAFLDLSRTLAARDRSVLARLKHLPLLQVLKLRNIHLRDEDIVSLASAIGKRVRSLDVSENDLTDHSVRALLGSCFDTEEDDVSGSSNSRQRIASNMPVEDWPPGFVQPDPAILDEFRDESYDERFVRRLTLKVVSRLPFEDLPQSGITHLYISDNQLSVEGLAALIRSKKLHVLDVGSINALEAINRPRSNSSTANRQINGSHLGLPGIEKLNPVLGRCGHEMTSLRIDQCLVSSKAPSVEEDLPLAVCELATEQHQQPSELEAPTFQISELADTAPPTYELDSREVAPAYELPTAPTDAPSPVLREKSGLFILEQQQAEIHRGSVYAPEVANLEDEDQDDDERPVVSATGLGSMAQVMNGVSGPRFSATDINIAGTSSLTNGASSLSRALIRKQRKTLRAAQMSKSHGLVPAMLPKLRTLVLTKVPCHEKKRKVVNALIAFIEYCSSEAKLAANEARLEPNSLRKPGQSTSQHHHHQSAREIFALQRIVLEMAPAADPRRGANGLLSPGTPSQSKYTAAPRTKSSTEDADSEAMWSASENDFTFFDNEEECGLPAAETSNATISAAGMSFSALPEMTTTTTTTTPSLSNDAVPGPNFPISRLQGLKHPALRDDDDDDDGPIDIVKELAAFRRERKAAFEDGVAADGHGHVHDVHVEGYWPGEVKVVRGHSGTHSGSHGHGHGHSHGLASADGGSGKLDYYGNYFEGGVYR